MKFDILSYNNEERWVDHSVETYKVTGRVLGSSVHKHAGASVIEQTGYTRTVTSF